MKQRQPRISSKVANQEDSKIIPRIYREWGKMSHATTKINESDLPFVPAVCAPVLPALTCISQQKLEPQRPITNPGILIPLRKFAAMHFSFRPLPEDNQN